MPTKSVSLFFELTELQGVLEAARTLALQFQAEPLHDVQPARLATQIGAVLALGIERVRLVRCAIEGFVDPGLVLARHNAVDEEPDGDHNILLPIGRGRRT